MAINLNKHGLKEGDHVLVDVGHVNGGYIAKIIRIGRIYAKIEYAGESWDILITRLQPFKEEIMDNEKIYINLTENAKSAFEKWLESSPSNTCVGSDDHSTTWISDVFDCLPVSAQFGLIQEWVRDKFGWEVNVTKIKPTSYPKPYTCNIGGCSYDTYKQWEEAAKAVVIKLCEILNENELSNTDCPQNP